MRAADRIGAGGLRIDPLDAGDTAEGARRGMASGSLHNLTMLRQHCSTFLGQQGGQQNAQTPGH